MLVTGGTGFIGRHLVNALLQEGHRVRLLARPRSDLSLFPFPVSPAAEGVEVFWGQVTDASVVEAAARGVDTVFHLAACARPWARDPREFTAVNVEGTRLVCDAALTLGVRRLVHVSTELVQDATPDRTAYQRTKRAAEALVAAYVRQGGDAVIVRPTRVYGPGPLNPANSVTKIIALYRRGLFRVLVRKPASRSLLSTLPWRGGQGVRDRREARANYVYVDDVVAGMLLTAERGTRGAAYLLGGENLTLRELLGLVDEATGTHHGVLPLPCPVARTVARLCELGALLGIEPLITRDWLDVLTEDRPMSAAKAQAELGYTPHNARDGVAATVAWLEAGSPGVGIPALKGRLGRSAEAS